MKMIAKFVTPLAALMLVSGASSCGRSTTNPDFSTLQEEWDQRNDPRHLQRNYEHHFAALPVSGTADAIPWPDTYWPGYNGGLAARWNDPETDDNWAYALNDEATSRTLDREALDKLSPAEKYDVFIGNFNYDFVKYERKRTSPEDEGWFGLCHGWAPASYSFKEPAPITLKGPSGIEVPFGSSDIKGLLTFAQQHARYPRSSAMLGGRCNKDISDNPDDANAPECRDTNAGSFHVVLTNQLGIQRKAFVADVTRDLQVWNQPIYGFETSVVNE
jgi:hypothetical protein